MNEAARKDAQDWGKYRAQELVRDMRSLAGDYAIEQDAIPKEYLSVALKAVAQEIRKQVS